jgi:hypothetical protein
MSIYSDVFIVMLCDVRLSFMYIRVGQISKMQKLFAPVCVEEFAGRITTHFIQQLFTIFHHEVGGPTINQKRIFQKSGKNDHFCR